MNLFSRDAIQADVLINRLTILLIVAESIEHLSQCHCHDGGSVENVFGADDVRMACGGGHDRDFRHGA